MSAPEVVFTALGGLGVVLAGWSVVRSLRQKRIGADVLALLAVVGALAAGERLAAAVIAVMVATGMVLDSHASRRAERDLRALVDRQPRLVRRRVVGASPEMDRFETVEVESVRVGDVLVVTAGEVIPADGQVCSPHTTVDESALTGEPMPRSVAQGDSVRSGSVNAGAPFDLRATATPGSSAYAAIVRMAEAAGDSRAPMVRLADRAAAGMLVVGVAAAAFAWAWTGSLGRAVAVLVVATPCPLILAVPIALSGGLSRAARRGIVVKGGEVLERLSKASVLLVDKTGTLTVGLPSVTEVVSAEGSTPSDALRFAAAVERMSSHVTARALVAAAEAVGLVGPTASDVFEELGSGVGGVVEGRRVRVGSLAWLGSSEDDALVARGRHLASLSGGTVLGVEVDDALAAVVVVGDEVRPEAARTIRRLRALGLRRVVMVTGDRAATASLVARRVGIDEVRSAQDPGDKAGVAQSLRGPGEVVVMVGDGINDAPVLAAADVGVVMGGHGDSSATEVADVVIGIDRLDRVADGVAIAQRSSRIARQSAFGGVALSVIAIGVALSGHLPPAWGALVQELIDVAAILNALRVLVDHSDLARLEGAEARVAHRFSAEHALLRPSLDRLADLADALGAGTDSKDLTPARDALAFLQQEWQPHEVAEENELYPVVAGALGRESTAVMSRGHVEIAEMIEELAELLDDAGESPTAEHVKRARRLLYGLHAVLRLHTAQEDEGYLSLADPETPDGSATG